jgi:butyryl-CoA dehydrogenase
MDFELSVEQKMVQSMVHDFARNEIEPVASKNDQEGIFPQDLIVKAGELGLCGMMIPERYGGSEIGALAYILAIAEVAYSCGSTAVTLSVTNLSGTPLLNFGTEEQKHRWLEPLATGSTLGAFCVTEPLAGSNPSEISTTARRKGKGYVIDGSKVFITNGGYAGLFIVIARSGDKGKSGLSAFIVERDTPGLEIGKPEKKMGLRASNTVSLFFNDCYIPEENRIGPEGAGIKVALAALDSGRLGIAAQGLGMATAAQDEMVRYCGERKQFGKLLSSHQAISFSIADNATELEAARLLLYSAATAKDRGQNFSRQASMAKLYATEALNRIAYRSLQAHGGYGYIADYKIERIYRDARVTTIYEGTSEIQRMVIARETIKNA